MTTDRIFSFIETHEPKVCSFSYLCQSGTPVVGYMGYVLYRKKILLHTNTWTRKWESLETGDKVALCIGNNHLTDYIQLEGTIEKMESLDRSFDFYENIYLSTHKDSVHYCEHNDRGILIISPSRFRYASVEGCHVTFEEENMEEWELKLKT